MIYCSKCGSAFNEELGACPVCKTEVPGASGTPEEITAKKIAELTAPLPDPTEHASDEVHAATASPTSKSRRPSDSHAPRADKTAVSDSPSHEEMMSLLRSFGKKSFDPEVGEETWKMSLRRRSSLLSCFSLAFWRPIGDNVSNIRSRTQSGLKFSPMLLNGRKASRSG